MPGHPLGEPIDPHRWLLTADGKVVPRPAGRLRHHHVDALPLRTKMWAVPVYRLVYDPDGRSVRDRLHRRW